MRSNNKEKITVFHVMERFFSKGGTARKLLSLISKSDKERFRHVFLLFNNCKDNLVEDVNRLGGIVEEVSRPKNYDIRLFFDIIKFVKRYNVDIINTHFARADVYGTIVGLLCNRPVIKSVHGISWNESRFVIFLDRFLGRFRYLTVCNSHASYDAEIERSHDLKTIYIHNGVIPRKSFLSIEEALAYRERLGVPREVFLVGHVGGLVGWRRQDLIIEAMYSLINKGMDLYCLIAGNGPEEGNLKELVRSLALNNRVKFLDYIDNVGDFLSIIDVFVNMATGEGFGISVVEAMFAGLPVVLANAGALSELIIDNISGILVRSGRYEDLANILLRLEKDKELRQRLGKAAKERAVQKFSISRFVLDFENLYLQCYRDNRSH